VASAAEQLDLTWGEAMWPESFRRVHALSYPLFQWANVVIGIPVLLLISWLLGGGLLKLLRPAVIRFNQEQGDIALTRVRWLVFLLIFAVLLRMVAMDAVTVGGRIVLGTAGNVLIIVAISWLLVRITRLATRSRVLRLQRTGMPSSIAAVELTGWLVRCVFFIAGLFLILRLIGVEVTTAVAGLGVGGIAIAFAATKTLENLFGTVTIVTDKPIRVGDYCQAGGTEGNVESIGLRSTRIRTPDRALVTIPNGQLATMTLGNLSDRDKFLFRHNIRLRYDSTAEQLRHVLAEIKKALLAHPQLEPVSARTRFTRFSEYSVDLEVFAYVLTRDALAFLEIQEKLLLQIMDIVEASGTAVALPYQTDTSSPHERPLQKAGERTDRSEPGLGTTGRQLR
jgi:MscS family membrane protein